MRTIKVYGLAVRIKNKLYIDVREIYPWRTGAKRRKWELARPGVPLYEIIPCEISYENKAKEE